MHTHERIYKYVERKFQASGCTKFPTVRQVSRALGLKQSVVVEELEGDPEGRMFTTEWNVSPPDPIGDHFVETY
jgi:hypothetical protein